MSTLKQLRLRISGVKSTQKITKAMKMVAASKLIKAQDSCERARPYSNSMYKIISGMSSSLDSGEAVSPLLNGNGRDENHLIIVISSDRGLCGGFNGAITKKVKYLYSKLGKEGKKVKILCIGKRAFEQLKLTHRAAIIDVINNFSKVTYDDGKDIASKIQSMFYNNEFDKCSVVYTEFQNIMKQIVKTKQIIPLSTEGASKNCGAQTYEYEPREDKILNQILPLNLAIQIYYMLLESSASEHGARMTAMDSATNNASDMIQKLTLIYNRSRQAVITKELIEIISSAEVV
jgi:F-type H+-transporting ATPase subunit gamma